MAHDVIRLRREEAVGPTPGLSGPLGDANGDPSPMPEGRSVGDTPGDAEARQAATGDELAADASVRHSNEASPKARALADRVADAVRGSGNVEFHVESGPNYAVVHLPGLDVPSDALLAKIRPLAEAAGLAVVFLDRNEIMSGLIDPQPD